MTSVPVAGAPVASTSTSCSTTGTTPKGKKKPSDVWKYFIKKQDGTADCRFCGKKIKTSGNTSNLMGHVSRVHSLHATASTTNSNKNNKGNDEDNDNPDSEAILHLSTASTITLPLHSSVSDMDFSEEKKMKQSSISENFKDITSYSPGGTKHTRITNGILFMLIKDNLPFKTVENSGFLEMVRIISPLYKVPSRRHFTRLLDNKFEFLANKFKERLRNYEHYSITTDVWTDVLQTRSFMGITIHFLENTNMKSATFGVYQLNERHTAEHLSKILHDACNEWEIPYDKIVGVVTDNGANIVKACHDEFGKSKHIRCFAHTLNLVPHKTLENSNGIPEILDKVRRIVRWFKQSVIACDELRKLQASRGLSEGKMLKLIQDVPTRWNSVYYMIERFIILSKDINEILLNNLTAPPMLTSVELEVIKELKLLLKPLELATSELSGEKYITISKIIPLVYCIQNQIDKIIPTTDIVTNCKNVLKTELSRRFGQIELVETLAISTILDPRFKKLHFKDFNGAANAVRHIRKYIKDEIENNNSANEENLEELGIEAETEDGNDLWTHHKLLLHSLGNVPDHNNSTETIGTEISQYLNAPLNKLGDNPFELWNQMRYTFPNLYKMARRYLQIPGTSVPAERLFSKTGQVMTELRNRLTGKRLKKIIFMQSLEKNDWN